MRKQHLYRSIRTAVDAFSVGARLRERNAPDGRLGLLLDPLFGGAIRFEEGADESAVLFQNLLHLVVGRRIARVGVTILLGSGEKREMGLIEALPEKAVSHLVELENLL